MEDNSLTSAIARAIIPELNDASNHSTDRARVLSAFLLLFPEALRESAIVALWWADGNNMTLRSLLHGDRTSETIATARLENVAVNNFPMQTAANKLSLPGTLKSAIFPIPTSDLNDDGVIQLFHPSINPELPSDWQSAANLIRLWLTGRRDRRIATFLEKLYDKYQTNQPSEAISRTKTLLEEYCGQDAECKFYALHPLAKGLFEPSLELAEIEDTFITRTRDIICTRVSVPASTTGKCHFIGFRMQRNSRTFTPTDHKICEHAARFLEARLPELILAAKARRVIEIAPRLMEYLGSSLVLGQREENRRYCEIVSESLHGISTVTVVDNEPENAPGPDGWIWHESVAYVQVHHHLKLEISFGFDHLPEHERLALVALISELRYILLTKQDPKARLLEIREVRHAFKNGLSAATGNLWAISETFERAALQYETWNEDRILIADRFFLSSDVSTLIRTCKHAVTEIEMFLDCSRIVMSEMRAESLQRTIIDAESSIRDMLELYRQAATRRDVKIRIFRPRHQLKSTTPIVADSTLLRLLVANLLDNAIKYSVRAGEVVILIERLDTSVRIAITNTGPLIPDEMQSSVFEPFVRIKYIGRQEMPGTGLGLASCKRISELHGWDIKVESFAIAKDHTAHAHTTFTVTIPIRQETH